MRKNLVSLLAIIAVVCLLGWLLIRNGNNYTASNTANINPEVEINDTTLVLTPPEDIPSINGAGPAYSYMHAAFAGEPGRDEIERQIRAVLQLHGQEVTYDNAIHLGNALVALRKDSQKGITEMQILNYVAKNGSAKLTLAQDLGIAATVLEK